jgi:predicted DCC family thiol-disulfide oxidoreductase YuxK
MDKQYSHLVFYDGECGLCDRAVQFLLRFDTKKLFAFAPLQGSTAGTYLQQLPPEYKQVDSMILIENYQTSFSKTFIMAKAVFRIFWLMGGAWVLLGWLSFLPSILFDWGYRLVARNRHRLFSPDSCTIPPPDQKDRFLP